MSSQPSRGSPQNRDLQLIHGEHSSIPGQREVRAIIQESRPFHHLDLWTLTACYLNGWKTVTGSGVRKGKWAWEGITLLEVSAQVPFANAPLQTHHFCKYSIDKKSLTWLWITAKETIKGIVWRQKHAELPSFYYSEGQGGFAWKANCLHQSHAS